MTHFFTQHPIPAKTGNWGADNEAGRAYAEIFLSEGVQNPTLLNHVVQAMAKAGAHGGLEVGFFHRLSEELSS